MTDETDYWARRLGRSLSTVDVPSSTVDIVGVVRAGRARVRRRYAVAAAAVATLALLAAPTALAGWRGHGDDRPATHGPAGADGPVSPGARPFAPCRVSPLELPADLVATGLTGMDAAGRYVTGDATRDDTQVSVRWDRGVPEILPVAAVRSSSNGVNTAGVVVGSAERSDGTWFPWVYRGGVVDTLPSPDGYPNFVQPLGVNAAGDIAGIGEDPTFHDTVALLWPHDRPGTVRVLPTPALPRTAVQMNVAGVADDGSVVGSVGDLDHAVPYSWDAAGRGAALALPAGATSGFVAGVRGLWAFGGVTLAGQDGARDGTLVQNPVRWSLRTGQVEFVAPDLRGQARSGNSAGDVILDIQPALVHAWRGVRLEGLTDRSATQPFAVNEAGATVVGLDVAPSAEGTVRTPVVWHCSD